LSNQEKTTPKVFQIIFIGNAKYTRLLYRVLLIDISITQCNEIYIMCNMQHITICCKYSKYNNVFF